jgi:cysteine desulfurase/selenocysteine lyase
MSTPFSQYRSEFPITQTHAFLNHSSVSPLPRRSAQAVERVLLLQQTTPADDYLPDYIQLMVDLKAKLAKLINAEPDEIVFMPNTGTGLNTAANSLPLRAGDNVIILEGDYPANVYPWWNLAHKGVLTKTVPQRDGGLDLDLLASRVDSNTQVVALCSVVFSNGYRNDLKAVGEFCRERGIFFVVDGVQSVGALPIDVRDCHIDMLACASHKWLLAGMGSGFLYVNADLMDQLTPGAYVGTFSVVDPFNFLDYNLTLQPGAERFAVGTFNHAGLAALDASVGLLLEVGIERVGARILELSAILWADLARLGFRVLSNPEHRSGIVTVAVADPAAACAHLLASKVVASVRGGALRFAPHFYNTPEEVCRVGELLSDHT